MAYLDALRELSNSADGVESRKGKGCELQGYHVALAVEGDEGESKVKGCE